MEYEIIDGEVLEVENVVTETQTAIVKRGIGRDRKITLSVDKAILANGVDKAIITAQLQDWQNVHIAQAVNVSFGLNGVIMDLVTDEAGLVSIEFTSLTSGLFPVSCSAPGFDTGTVEVVVNAA